MITLFKSDFVFLRTFALLVFSMIARSARAASKSANLTFGSDAKAFRFLTIALAISSPLCLTRSDHCSKQKTKNVNEYLFQIV